VNNTPGTGRISVALDNNDKRNTPGVTQCFQFLHPIAIEKQQDRQGDDCQDDQHAHDSQLPAGQFIHQLTYRFFF
jgi:hypothetical protein